MEHVIWFKDNKLAGRQGPTWKPWDLKSLHKGGFNSILSLDSKGVQHDDIVQAGFSHKVVELPDYAPADHEARLVCHKELPAAGEFLCNQIDRGRTVLVHCMGGRDRTGLAIAYYTCLTTGLSPEDALMEVRKCRADALTAEGWEEMGLAVMNSLLRSGGKSISRSK